MHSANLALAGWRAAKDAISKLLKLNRKKFLSRPLNLPGLI
jgi:hypothetical protein